MKPTAEEIYNAVKILEDSAAYWMKETEKLRQQIKDMNSIYDTKAEEPIMKRFDSLLPSDKTYSKSELAEAYTKMLKYEGLSDSVGTLITDTLFRFLGEIKSE